MTEPVPVEETGDVIVVVLPDDLKQRLERQSKRRSMPRNELIVQAVESLLRAMEVNDDGN